MSSSTYHRIIFLLLLSASTAYPLSLPVTNSSIGQQITKSIKGMALGALIACSLFTGCERGELRPFADVLQERVDAEVIPTQNLYVLVDDKEYEGVIGKDSNGRIIAQTFIGGGAFVFLQQVEGTAGFSLDKHSYIGERAYLDGARDLETVQLSGIIEEVFHNGYYLIAIDSERYTDDSLVALLTPYSLIAHEFLLEKEDGSSFFDNAERTD